MKCLSTFLACWLLIALCACGGGGGGHTNPSPSQPTLSSITVAPGTFNLHVALDTQQMAATGHYSDGSTKDLTSSVTWNSSSSTVASISASGLVTPASAGTANISASSGSVSGSTSVTVIGIAGAYIEPSGPTLSFGGSPATAQLATNVFWTDGKTKDVTTDTTWSSSDEGVATVSSAGLVSRATKAGYTTVNANWKSVAIATAVSVTTDNMSAADLNGTYVFLLNGIDSSGPGYYAGTFNADGVGSITGQMTASAKDGVVATPTAFTGGYSVFPDGRGDMTIVPPAPFTTARLRFALSEDASSGRAILFDPQRPTAMTGVFQRQAAGPFDNSSLDGTYVFKIGGADNAQKPEVMVGMFAADANGHITSGTADINDNGAVNGGGTAITPLGITGSYVVNSDGRGSMTLKIGSTQYHFSLVLVSTSLLRVLCTDSGQHLLGQVEKQEMPSGAGHQSMDGNYTFLMEKGGRGGIFGLGGSIHIGPMDLLGGWGSLAMVPNFSDVEFTHANRTMSPNGRGSLDLQLFVRTYNTYANYSFAVYMVSPSRMYWIETDSQPDVLAGLVMGESDGNLSGSYIYMGGALGVASGTEGAMLAVLDSNTSGSYDGAVSGIADFSLPSQMPGRRVFGSTALSGAFSADANSVYEKWLANFTGAQSTIQNAIFYMNSDQQALMFGQTSSADNPIFAGWITLR